MFHCIPQVINKHVSGMAVRSSPSIIMCLIMPPIKTVEMSCSFNKNIDTDQDTPHNPRD